MRKLLYILMLFALACSCQREELVETETQGNCISTGEATISFSAILPTEEISTKSMGGTLSTGIENLYLVVFDANGMLVETRKAELGDNVSHNDHPSEQKFSVTLTLTEKPRIIHFIANCPVNQVIYGHEASVIGNMYVENGKVAYWARIEVDNLVIETDSKGNAVKDSKGNPLLTEMDKFKCVPMLRNYAQLTVTNDEDNFQLEGFMIYNVTHRGTIAPYNSYSKPVGFQSFTKADNTRYTYPELYSLPYYGHTLTSTELITTVPSDFITTTCPVDVYRWTNGVSTTETVTGYGPVNLYERKISVKQGDEADWRESPSHVILKGKFDSDGDGSFNDEESTFYKVDLTRKIDGVPQYYNILRNFHYNFTVHNVHTNGYANVEDAVAGTPGNNLSGSVSTSKFDNISDQEGRLWVSYTAKTLVEGGEGITLDFYYKYVPNLDEQYINVTANDTLTTSIKTGVKFEGIIGGNVIDATQENKTTSIVISNSDETAGPWSGYRKVTFKIKEPKDIAEFQIFKIKAIDETNDAAEILSREISLDLRKPYDMRVVIPTDDKKVATKIGETVEVDILIPDDLTDNLFPLDINIEAEKRSLSPDLNLNSLPVVSGNSVIPEKNGMASFYYVYTIASKADYNAISQTVTIGENNYKVIKTYWVTNRTDNESYVYAQNEYFKIGKDNFVNAKAFVSLTLNNGNTVREGAGRTVSATLVLPESDNSYTSRNIKFTLEGLSRDGSTEPFYITPTSRTVTINNLVTTDASSTLKITAEEDSYAEISASVGRRRSYFTTVGNDLGFSKTSLGTAADETVDFSFTLSDYEEGMTVNVALEGLVPADNNLTAVATRAYTNYTYKPTSTNCTIKLKTQSAGAKTCKVQLSADGFDDSEIATIEQVDKITIEKGKLIATITGTTFSSGGTISIYTTSNYSGTALASYNYERGKNGNTNNAKATNSSTITLDGVSADTTLYIRYTKSAFGTTTNYDGSFILSDALDSNGATVQLTNKQ